MGRAWRSLCYTTGPCSSLRTRGNKDSLSLEKREKEDPQHGLAQEGDRRVLAGRSEFGVGLWCAR